jgi:hypothetical protein
VGRVIDVVERREVTSTAAQFYKLAPSQPLQQVNITIDQLT